MAAEATLNKISPERWRWIIQGQIEGRERDILSGYLAAEAKGRKKALIENAKNLLLETDLPVEKIAKCCSLPLEQVISLKDELTKETEKD